MDEATAKAVEWMDRLKAELRRDKRKSAALIGLLVVTGIVAGRVVVTHKVPEKAGAGQVLEQTGPDGSVAPNAPVVGGADELAERNRSEQARREEYLSRMDRRIARDLFRPNLYAYPPLSGQGDRVTLTEAQPTEGGLFQHIRQWVEDKRSAEQEEAARLGLAHAQAQSLKLQSMMLGSSPVALINGQALRPGDSINGFLVKEISARGCVVTKDGVEVVLQMKE